MAYHPLLLFLTQTRHKFPLEAALRLAANQLDLAVGGVRQQPLRQLNKAFDRPTTQRFGGAHLKADRDLARRFRQCG